MTHTKPLSVYKQKVFDHLSKQLRDFVATTPIDDLDDVLVEDSGVFTCKCCGETKRELVIVAYLENDDEE